jgi:ATP phosphoribosyltransferase
VVDDGRIRGGKGKNVVAETQAKMKGLVEQLGCLGFEESRLLLCCLVA